ncbi:M28 family peptidase [Runella zeae]|uniref:M28 family peptidase n=1 Tax=Runella zeae TaxID=94255 RepID=UPI0003FB4737|nr:M28 family peptidase [Runella zeae]
MLKYSPKSLLATTLIAACVSLSAAAQSIKKLPESQIQKAEVELNMRFLASDELQGRRTGEQGNLVAARYLAEQLRFLGVKPVAAQADYLQPVPFVLQKMAKEGVLIANGDTLHVGKEFVILGSDAVNFSADVVFVGYGQAADYTKDVKGKIVVAQVGTPESKTPQEIFAASNEKRKLATEKGAALLIELFTAQIPWGFASRYFGNEKLSLGTAATGTPHIWVNGQQKKYVDLFKNGATSATFYTTGRAQQNVMSYNVVGVIEGTDPVLKNEYIVVSAHFDHVGMGKKGGNTYTAADSIFNGARDNAFGTVAMLTAAKTLTLKPTKRSILLIGYTAEEVGLLGSKYYSEHPLVPLKQCVFNLNSDGAGVGDRSIVSVIGLNRTNCNTEIEAACKAFGLGVFADPAPEQNLFDRSDNVNLAAKGIPAPDFAPGFKSFDGEIAQYYHQAADNPQSVDFDYLLKFCQSFAYAARLIANKPITPYWVAGDKYEPAAKALYGK